MQNIPKLIDDAQLLYFCEVDPNFDKNPRFKKGELKILAITTYDHRSFYVFYCDQKLKVLSDNQFNTAQEAMNRIKTEFAGMPIHWQRVS